MAILYLATVKGLTGFALRRRRWRLAREWLRLWGAEIPREVVIGADFWMPHRGMGVIIQSNTHIGDRVSIYPCVSVGRADIHVPDASVFPITIEDDAVLCSGARILTKGAPLRVGMGTVVAANAVLMSSTGDFEVWAGAPAQLVGKRQDVSIPRPRRLPAATT